ncbi:DUF6346 domain-containing protein [Actinoplanes sp. NPDC049596]|uniref:DUF6346 domain-containing protein n=1 Tax=unclassified Actinoplanes TaxID=2626549 RepID=UPI003434DECA
MTIGRFTGHDFADARRTGTATVQQCERRGPITLDSFGNYGQCTVTIAWTSGPSSRVLIDKPGFFTGENPGDTFEIGEHTGRRGCIGYSRPELPDRARPIRRSSRRLGARLALGYLVLAYPSRVGQVRRG